MKIFIINLEKDVGRRRHMEDMVQGIRLEYEFVEAVEGSKIDASCRQLEFSDEIGRKLSAGEVGCLLSHQKIYSIIIEGNISYALILEDDVVIDGLFIREIECVLDTLESFDVCLLGYHTPTNAKYQPVYCQYGIVELDGTVKINYDKKPSGILQAKTEHYEFYKLLEKGYGAYGYVISKKGAEKLLEQNKSTIMPIDNFTGDSAKNEVYCIYPQVVRIQEDLSQESNLVPERSQAILYQKLLRYENEFNIINKKIACFSTEKQIVIYGLNELGMRVYQHCQKRVSHIIDKKHAGKTFDVLTVTSIKTLDKNKNFLFVVTAISPIYVTEIVAILHDFMEYPHYVTCLEI